MAISFRSGYYQYRRYFTSISALYQKKQYRAYAGLVLSLFTIAFFAFFAIRPTLVTIASLMKEIEDKEMIAQKLEEKINALSRARNEYDAISAELPLIEDALPQKTNPSLLVRQIETLASQNGVVLQSIQVGEAPLLGEKEYKPQSTEAKLKEKGLSALNFSLSISGSYQNLKNFLQDLEELRRLITPSSFAFKIEQKGESLILTVSSEAYYLVQTKEK
jgi:Tfp pilus assembly protein PilO